MKNKLLIILLSLISCPYLQAQQLSQLPAEGESRSLELKFYERSILQKIELEKALAERNLPAMSFGSNGQISQAMYVTPTGHIIYNTTFNIGSGRSISTNKVWPGGNVGVSLTGANMPNRIGIWDGGRVLLTHQEFGGRVTQTDGASTLSAHATHVAGTMIASGINANAKGMSYMATLKAYDWTNDDIEMTQAAQAGMLVSNHSYGTISGWYYSEEQSRWVWYGDPNESNTEDYKFGWYDQTAQSWDQIAQSYPNYLICKAAGNDRGEVRTGSTWYYSSGLQGSGTPPPADGGATGFDCIATSATAKNILTVGAVNKVGNSNTNNGWTQASDVVMSSFSGWGPTDDGRIKPDVVAPGVSIFSSTSSGNDQYATLQGTSMATPAVTGSLLLVQQHYGNVKSKFMRSATLKGLAIHTADEAGAAAGPDYRFGWGMLNTASCVKFINDSNINKLEERSLSNGQIQTLKFNVEAGKPLRVTICWTDQPGTPVTSSFIDNTKKMLVNDLDIRLKRESDNTTFSPYVLDPANPNSPATTGDNVRDNVEMIHLAAPTAGLYTLQISHKGTLAAAQPFSLLISNGVEKALATFTADQNVVCPGQTVTFTDASTGGVTQRVWYFPGGTPSTSTSQSQAVTYPNAGQYPVALKITTALGIDSIYKEDFVTVGGLPLPFTENFETSSPNLSSWKVINPDADRTWELSAIQGTTPGDRAASILFYDYGSVAQRDGLTSPALNFKGQTNTSLTFKHAYTKFSASSLSDSLIIYASTDCGNTWIRVTGFAENGTGSFATFGSSNGYSSDQAFIPASASQWCGGGTGTASCKTVSLSAFDGQPSVMIKFEGYNNYSNNLYIDNVSVTGVPLKPVAAFEAAKTTVCAGEPVSFTDKSDNTPASWSWTFTGGAPATSTIKRPVVTYATPGTYTVKLKATNVSGSDSTSITNYITVIAPPKAPNIKSDKPAQFCVGDSVLLSTDSTGPVNWYADDVLIAQNVQQLYASQSAMYRVARSNGICEASSSITVLASVKAETPTITATVTGTAFCPGSSSTLTSSAASGNQWYRNGTLIAGSTAKTYVATDSGSYTVIANPGGCPSDASLPKAYTLHARPTVGAISGPDNPVRDQSVNYTVTSEAGHTYQWSIVNGIILSGNNTASVSVKFSSVDSGTISVVSKNTATTCTSTSSVKRLMVAPVSGLNEYAGLRSFNVYPVPAKTAVNVQLESTETHKAELKVVNLLGQTVKQQSVVIGTTVQTHTIDVSQLQKGIYFLELQNDQNRIVKKIVVE
jgi:PKD repeat protein